MPVYGSGDGRRRRLPCRSGKAAYWRAALPLGHATTFAAARWRRAHRGLRRGFLPISMPITAIAVLGVWDMACSLSLVPLAQLRLLAGQEHGRTIPLADSPPHDLKHTICAVMRVLTATTLGILAFLAS